MVFFQLKPRRRSKGLHDLFLFKISFADLEKEKRQMFEWKERSRNTEVTKGIQDHKRYYPYKVVTDVINVRKVHGINRGRNRCN